jgi:hypothetical protein
MLHACTQLWGETSIKKMLNHLGEVGLLLLQVTPEVASHMRLQ